MRINIPQYLRAEVAFKEYDDYSDDKKVDVYIGETLVYTASVSSYYDDEDAEMEAISAFGEILKLKIGD